MVEAMAQRRVEALYVVLGLHNLAMAMVNGRGLGREGLMTKWTDNLQAEYVGVPRIVLEVGVEMLSDCKRALVTLHIARADGKSGWFCGTSIDGVDCRHK